MGVLIRALLAGAAVVAAGTAHATASFDFSVTSGNGGGTLFSGTLTNTSADARTEGTHSFTGVSALTAFRPNGTTIGSWGSGYTNLSGTYSVSYTVAGGAVTFNAIEFSFGNQGLFRYSPTSGGVFIDEATLPNNWSCDTGGGCKFAGIRTTSFSSVTASDTVFTQTTSEPVSVPEIDGGKLPVAAFLTGSLLLWAFTRRRLPARQDSTKPAFC